MISQDQFEQLRQLIEDGELDDFMTDLREVMDERNSRRREAILKLVKSVWGDDAQIVAGSAPAETGNTFIDRANRRAARAPIDYVPGEGMDLPPSAQDSMSEWPSPIVSQALAGGGTPETAQAIYSPVTDPMASGGGNSFGDGNPDIISTGGQIG
jgi:hypothetical protein